MVWSTVRFSTVDALWALLAFCFIVAFGLYKVSSHLPKNYQESFVFVLFQDLIRYGKTKQNLKRNDWLRMFDVPKRWFWHFYAVSVCWSASLLFLYINSIQHHPLPSWLTWILANLTGVASTDRESQVPQVTTLLLLLLLWLHSFRRLLECCFVSVFSDGAIHAIQYLFGLVYYIALGLTALSTERLVIRADSGPLFSQLTWHHLAGCTVFVLASLLQHQSMVLLAQLRTGKSGNIETVAHKMPTGGWFELVSCPHYFAELLIYISLCVVSGGLLLTWWLIVFYVFFNQALAAQLCHDLYKGKYESYPRQRKAFIPFVL